MTDNQSDRVKTTKTIARFVTGLSASYVIGNIIKNNVAPTTKIQKIEVVIGTIVIGGVVINATDKYVDDMIDKIVNSFREMDQATQPTVTYSAN